MNNFFEDSKIPGGTFLKWVFIVLVVMPLLIAFVSNDSGTLNFFLKTLVIIFDIVCIYIIVWIIKIRSLNEYSKIAIATSVLAIGETLMAFF